MTAITDIVAIDGPAGAGKSTVARGVADALGYAFLDTGAMYRAATWWVLRHNIDFDDPRAIEDAVRVLPLEMREEAGRSRVWVGEHEVTDDIRTSAVTDNIWRVDEVPGVRRHLVELQRAFGAKQPTVAEGRDMGTVVFPDARCKIYLDAQPEVRARRRTDELQARGQEADYETVLAAIRERDHRGMTRADSPLRPAPDAVRIDTTGMSLKEAVDAIVREARKTQ
ncbi:MAG: (d)CMP kinase [Candidatus Hydrogenedentota bacterium]